MKRNKTFIFLIFTLLLANKTLGQGISLTDSLTFPNGTINGTLANELKYILKQNNLPKDKIEIRLLLSVGSNQEKKGEEGIAHFIEHLAFNGTNNFPEKTAIRFWESIGCKYGNTINAYTGYDRTVYTLSIPSGKNNVNIKKTLEILSDWLSNINIKEINVEKEKGIIKEEIASYTHPDRFAAIKKGNQSHLVRYPIGTYEQIEKITAKKLKVFYKNWYTPQNATLIIVGDISTSAVEKEIKLNFGKLKKTGIKTPSMKEINYGNEPLFLAKIDTTTNYAKLSWIYPYTYIASKTISELIEKKKEKFVLEILTNRLKAKKIPLNIFHYWYLQKTGLLELSLQEKNDSNLICNFKKSIALIEGTKQQGLLVTEISELLPQFIEKIQSETLSHNSETWCNKFIDMSLFNEKHLATKEQQEIIIETLKKETIENWNKTLRKTLKFSLPLVCYSYHPSKHHYLSLNQLNNIFNEGKTTPDTSYKHKKQSKKEKIKIPESLLENIPFSESMILEENFFPNLKLHNIKLSNGVQLILKHSKSAKKINISLIGKGGLSLIPKHKYAQLESVAAYMDLGGIKNLPRDNYIDFMIQEKITYVNTIENYFHGCMLSAPTNKSKVLCNFLYQKLSSPELCYKDFEEIKKEEIVSLDEKKQFSTRINPLRKMSLRKEELTGNIIPYSTVPKSKKEIETLNLDSIGSFYQRAYVNSTDLICIVTGNFNIKNAKKEIVGTLSKLKSRKQKIKPKDHKPLCPTKNIEEQMGVLEQERLYFNLLYYGKYKEGLKNTLILKLMRDLIRNRLISELREKSSLIYSPYVDLSYHSYPFPSFYININGTTGSENCQEIRSIVHTIIKTLKNKKIKKDELSALKQSFLVTKKEYLDENNTNNWQDYLLSCFKNNITLAEINTYETILENITITDIYNNFQRLVSLQQEIYLYVGKCDSHKNNKKEKL